MDKFSKAILRIIKRNTGIIEKESLVYGFPDRDKTKVLKAISKLRDWGYVIIELTSVGSIITTNKMREQDIQKILNSPSDRYDIPKEEQIPREFRKIPFFIVKGEKPIHGNVSEYWFCSKKKNKNHVKCFIFNTSGREAINLGNIYDPESFISRALIEIDNLYRKNPFLKSDLVHNLSQDIVGNRQPIKAITEYLIHENYLVELSNNKFQRTGKLHKVDTLDFMTKVHELPPAAVMTDPNGKKAYYTEEEGLYYSLY